MQDNVKQLTNPVQPSNLTSLSPPNSKSRHTNERKLLKVFLLHELHYMLVNQFKNEIQFYMNDNPMENYAMDSKILQLIIKRIIDSGEYSLEGIARYTHIPYDVIYEAACGTRTHFSITSWTRIMNLLLQVNPELYQVLAGKLLELKGKDGDSISLLLSEEIQ